jgi:hypothetical protein
MTLEITKAIHVVLGGEWVKYEHQSSWRDTGGEDQITRTKSYPTVILSTGNYMDSPVVDSGPLH